MSQAGSFAISSLPPGTVVETLTGNTGGPVGPDLLDNINIIGDGTTITVAGSAITNTLTISALSSGGATSFPTDVGTATPLAGVLNIIADNAALNAGSSVSFSGSGNTVLLNVTDTNRNTIIGSLSGNNTIIGTNNTILGQFCGSSLTSGVGNIIVGVGSGSTITTAINNIIIGSSTATAFLDGNNNIIVGASAASTLFEGNQNIMIGGSSGASLFEGNSNIMIGENAGASLSNDNNNMMIGVNAGASLTSGTNNVMVGNAAGISLGNNVSNNTLLGINAANSLANGQHNIVIGSNAGTNYGASESNNILVGSTGIASESNTLRIGEATGSGTGQLNQAFISGINGVNVGSVATVVTENANQLGTAVITAGTGITVTPGVNTITIAVDGIEASSFVTDSGTATPSAGILNINAGNAAIHAGSSVSFSGSGDTVLFNVTDVRFNTIIGKDSGNLTISGLDNIVLGDSSGTSLSTGSENVLIGDATGGLLTSGSGNILIGTSTGDSLSVGSESYNIFIGTNINGFSGESNTLRISNGSGTGSGQVTRAFIGGINAVNVGSVARVVTENNDQLGTADIIGGTGITVTPGTNSIVISGSGTIVLSYKNIPDPLSPYVVSVNDDYLSVDCSVAPVTIELPNAATVGKTFQIKDRTGSAAINNITVTTVGGVVNIDAAPTFIMNSAYQAISVIGNNTSYEIY